MQLDSQVVRILKESDATADALARLVDLKKSRTRTYSLGVLARRAGTSKSYLSEVMAGKKKLNPRYADGICRALGLSFLEQATLRALVAFDAAKDAAARETAKAELVQTRRALGLVSLETWGGEGGGELLFAFDLYASFGLFRNAPTEHDLRALFREKAHHEVSACIHWLERSGAIVRDGDVFRYTEKGVVVATGDGVEGANPFLPYWRGAIEDALRALPTWASKKDESCFTSYVVSVRRDAYRARLEELKAYLLKFASSCDAADGDALVRMNLQIWPVRLT